MNDRSDDPSHHERTLLPRSYISLPLTAGVTSVRAYTPYNVVLFIAHWLTDTVVVCLLDLVQLMEEMLNKN